MLPNFVRLGHPPGRCKAWYRDDHRVVWVDAALAQDPVEGPEDIRHPPPATAPPATAPYLGQACMAVSMPR